MGKNDNRIVLFAQGDGRNLAKAVNKTASWAELCKLLSTPTVTAEKHKAYMAMNRDQQLHRKSVNGWISGAQCEGGYRNLRNVKSRNLITLDCDYPWDTFWPDIESGIHWLCTYEFMAISTRSSTPAAPRYRVVLPTTRSVTPDEYGPLVRIISLRIDYENEPMEQVDVVSSRKAQMMFLPTVSKDQEFQCHRNEGKLIDPDEQFAWFEEHHGDYHNLDMLPLYKGEEKLRAKADKAEDPTMKLGMIGDWCRAWPIEDLIAEFLSDIYVDPTENSGKTRYTYTGGTASNGAVIEDDGRFLYSWHGSDPVGEQLVNAWDLLRIHKFGHLDDKAKEDTSVMDLPSSKAMGEFVRTDKRYQAERTKSRYDLGAMFDDSEVGDEEFEGDEAKEDLHTDSPEYTEEDAPEPDPTVDGEWGFSDADLRPGDDTPEEPIEPKKAKAGKVKNPNAETWFAEELQVNKNGDIESNVHNVAAILYNDPRFYGKIRWDEFTRCVRFFDDIKTRTDIVPPLYCRDKTYGDRWEQTGHMIVRAILATPNGPGKVGYGLGKVTQQDVADGVAMTALRNSYHPLKDFLEAVEWDGVQRAERLFIDYLGLDDTPYARETAKLVLVASVARVYEPGMKFDYAPVLQGEQGIRKSTFIRTLYTSRWFGEVTSNLGDAKAVAEIIAGKWGNELPEMASQGKTAVAETKAFLSRVEDTVRFSYDRVVTVIRRQAIFWGTTNEDVYLKDRTGNRRFWVLNVAVRSIDTTALQDALPQLWAEALALYNAMRAMYPRDQHEDLPLMLTTTAEIEAKRLQEGAREQQADEEWTRYLADAFDHPITLTEFAYGYGKEASSFVEKGEKIDGQYVQRTVFCAADAAAALGVDWPPTSNPGIMKVLDKAIKAMPGWVPDVRGKDNRYKRWGGVNTGWYARENASREDVQRGFAFTEAPEHTEAEFANDYGFTDEDLGPSDDDIDNLV
ncbi:virulence-associated E family protein [Devosia submarina]|uniref:virulence-associated E family protein n=1 Tax=Devosia submarina TaxID=1173082 RepID=UPI000D3543FF|nr:virulence-associated E family protein [Devosia submarina]